MEEMQMLKKREHEKLLRKLFICGIVSLCFLFTMLVLFIIGGIPFKDNSLNIISVINNVIKLYSINRSNSYETVWGALFSVFYVYVLVKFIKAIVLVWKNTSAVTFPDIEKPKKVVLYIYRETGKIFASIVAMFVISYLIYQYDLSILSLITIILIITYVITKEVIILLVEDKEKAPTNSQVKKEDEEAKLDSIQEDDKEKKIFKIKIKPEVLDLIIGISCSLILVLISLIIIMQVMQPSMHNFSNNINIGIQAIKVRNVGSITYTYFGYHYIFRDIVHIALIFQGLSFVQKMIEKTGSYFWELRKVAIAMIIYTTLYMIIDTYFEKQLITGNIYFDIDMLKNMVISSMNTFVPIIITLASAIVLLVSPICHKKKTIPVYYFNKD